MKVYWTSEAEQDRSDIWEFIAADDLAAAVRLDERFSATTHQLAIRKARKRIRHT